MRSWLEQLMITSAGVSREILERSEYDFEYRKYIAIGANILLVAFLSFISVSYAFYFTFQSFVPSLLLGFVFGLVTFSLDRQSVATFRRQSIPGTLSLGELIKRRSREALAYVPQFLVIIITSIVVGFPIQLRLFQREIDARLAERSNAMLAALRNSASDQYPEIKTLQAENDSLRIQIEEKQRRTDYLEEAQRSETRYGTSGASHNERREDFLRSKAELDVLKKQNQIRIDANLGRLAEFQARIDSQVQQMKASERYGLFARIDAFVGLASENRVFGVASLLMFSFFILLFTTPLLLRIFSPVGPYEQFVNTVEAIAYKGIDVLSNENRDEYAQEVGMSKPVASLRGEFEGLSLFLCHASDDKPAVRHIHQRLSGYGVDVWLDEERILPGQNWSEEISRAVRDSDTVLICLSRGSITKKGFVQREIRFALEVAAEQPQGTIYLIPARLEECEIPGFLRSVHCVDLFASNGWDKLLKALRSKTRDLRLSGATTRGA